MAKYLDPKADLTFKKVFGEHPNLVASPTFQIIGKLEKFSDGNCGLSASFGNIAA